MPWVVPYVSQLTESELRFTMHSIRDTSFNELSITYLLINKKK